MIDLALIERLDLRDPAAVSTLQSSLRELIALRETSAAADVLARLEPRLVEVASVAEKLAEELSALRVLALSFLPDAELTKIFSTQLLSLVRNETVDVWTELRSKFLSLPVVDRDILKEQFVTALRANSEAVSAGLINTPQGPRPPTVGNWLRLYERSAGMHPTPEQREQFLSTNPDAVAQSPSDITALRRIVHLFDRLKLSSLTPEGLEEDIVIEDASGKLHVMSGGAVVALAPSAASAAAATPAPAPAPTTPVPLATPTPAPTPAPIAPPIVQAMPAPPRIPQVLVTPPPPVSPVTAPQPPVTSTGRPAAPALGHPDDDAEIRAAQEHINQAPTTSDAERVERTLDQFISQHQLLFPEPIMEKRFRMIMKAFIKGIRTAGDTTELLTRATKIGGMAYAPDLAHTLVEAATSVGQSYRDATPLPATPPPPPPSMAAPMPARPKVPNAPPSPAMPPIRPVPAAVAAPLPTPLYRPKPSPIIRRPDDRPAMSDIQVPSKMTGPVDELRTLTLMDFRRLGADTKQAVAHVIEKIDLLGEESFAKRAEGTNAWRQSPLYKLYLEMGVESMERGEPIGIVISRRSTSNRPYLSEHEFTAVADLNQNLRF